MLKTSLRLAVLLGVAAMFCVLAWLGWRHLGPQKPQVSQIRQEVADVVARQVVRDLREARAGLRSLVLVPLANDPTDHITDQLRSVIVSCGVFHLLDRSLNEKLRKAFNVAPRGVANLSEALNACRGRGADAVLFGSVDLFESIDNRGRLKMEIRLARIGTGEIVFERPYDTEFARGHVWVPGSAPRAKASTEADRARSARTAFGTDSADGVGTSLWARPLGFPVAYSANRFTSEEERGLLRPLLCWLTAMGLLPLMAFAFVRSTVHQRSNRANARALVLLVGVDMILAALLLGLHSATAIWLALLTVALAYNFWVLSFALKMEA